MILYKHPYRLVTKNGKRYTNARIIGKSEEDKKLVILTDCFNLLIKDESEVDLHWDLAPEYDNFDSVMPVTLNDFIETIEENIRELKLWVKENGCEETNILL